MKKVAEIIKKLQNTSGTNDKIDILSSNLDNEMLKNVLYYTYNPYLKYGIAEKKYEPIKVTRFHNFNAHNVTTIFDLLTLLAKSNINDNLRGASKKFIEQEEDVDVKEMYKAMLFKDLKIGVNATTINKVWSGLIPTFDVMLAESLHKQKEDYLDGKSFAVTKKLDGFRLVYLPQSKKFFTRQGQEMEGLDHLIPECDMLSKGVYVLDGELIHRNYDNLKSDDLYRLTTSVARKKGKTKEKAHLEFHLFDILPLSEFEQGKSIDKYEDRHYLLERLFTETIGLDFVKMVEWLYVGNDVSVIYTLLDEVVAQGEEGLMVSLLDGVYECKRSKNLLKVKQFHDVDALVVGVYEGTKRNKGTLDGLNIKCLYNGEEMITNVGSGFYESERELFFNYPETIIGKVIECKYFEVTNNKQGGHDLRFCTYQHRIREDKGVEDITDVAIV